jgi:LPXTG-motif cell wall-anchored protein
MFDDMIASPFRHEYENVYGLLLPSYEENGRNAMPGRRSRHFGKFLLNPAAEYFSIKIYIHPPLWKQSHPSHKKQRGVTTMKKTLATIVVGLLVMSLFPITALGAGHTLNDGDALDISTIAEGDTVTIAVNASATLTGSNKNITIVCEQNADLTLDNVQDDCSLFVSEIPIFQPVIDLRGGNTLTLIGDCLITASKYSLSPSISIGSGAPTNITTSGSTPGSLTCKGITGEGIYVDINSTLTIEGNAVIHASGGPNGAGVGGMYGYPFTINITGNADVTAIGGGYSAGIGESGITTWSRSNHATVNISGDAKIDATGGTWSPGIGGCGGPFGDAGTINISGGTIFATGGTGAPHDIGCGRDASGGTLSISGDAAVFLRHDVCLAPTTTTHTHIIQSSFPGGSFYGVPVSWTGDFGAYIRECTITYDFNNTSGTTVFDTAAAGATIPLPDGADLAGEGVTYANHTFAGWNTAANGSGTAYAPGAAYTFHGDTTLYAQWTAVPTLGSSVTNGSIYVGGRIVLTPNMEGGTWGWDSHYLSATFNSPATFTGLVPGTTTVTYTAEGVTASYAVTIKRAALPETGQDGTWIWILGGSAVLLLAAGAVLTVKKLKTRKQG